MEIKTRYGNLDAETAKMHGNNLQHCGEKMKDTPGSIQLSWPSDFGGGLKGGKRNFECVSDKSKK